MMKLTLAGFVVSALVLVGGGAGEEAIKKEQAKIKGSWKILKFETAKGDKEDFKDAVITFDGEGNAEMKKGDKMKKATYKINPAAKPKEIDLKGEGEENVGKGIYELGKDKLKIAFADGPNGQRPTEFTPKEEGRIIVITFERTK
jgi:uncharacterized protein (TIGR03067 family)